MSPVQGQKEMDWEWWKLYQPIRFGFADTVLGNKEEYETMIKACNERYSKALNDLNNSANSDKKSNLKKDTDEQVKGYKKGETLNLYTIGEWLDHLDKELYKNFK